jgi:CBS domain-containing protein
MSPGAEPQREMLSLVTARVRDAVVRKPFYVEGGTDLVSLCRELSARGLTTALVRDGARLGIFTTTDLRDALLRPQLPAELPVREVAHFDIVTVDAEADLFEALWLMVRHRVHRLVVMNAGEVTGLLGQLDLLSFVANHSHIIGVQIDEAGSVAELVTAAARVDEMVRLLHGSGIRIERVARLVSELNRRLVARCWQLVASPALVARSSLLVLGSEGRGEQILKTDQDNALVLPDGLTEAESAEAAAAAARLSEALVQLGWPPCPGGIMVNNALWRMALAPWRERIRGWVHGAEPDGPMQLAIFCDAALVAGDAQLFAAAEQQLAQVLTDADTFLARFAAAADQFQEPGGWFQWLTPRRDEQPLDLKKLGTFPIVHGVRALALQARIGERGTADRLRALAERGVLAADTARDLVEALHLLMGLRLTHQLRQREQGAPPSNEVRPSELSTLEREPLRDALAIVKNFRGWLRQHFRFDSL